MLEVAAVVVTYNGLPHVERALESVSGLDTVVVDHGSTDGTIDRVRAGFPAVQVVEQENLGLAAGWNRGIRETAAPYVLVLNSDAWVVDDAVDRLARFAEGIPRAAWVAPPPSGLPATAPCRCRSRRAAWSAGFASGPPGPSSRR